VLRTCSVVTAQAIPICRRQKREYKYRVYVTIVEFSPKGKKTGTVTVPRIVKADAESQQQLSPISYPMKSPVKLAPNNPTPGALGIFMIVASSTASVVTRGSSVQTQSLIPEPAGAAFGNQSRVKILSKLRIGGWG
jgi:hypothetical protein